MSLRRTLAIIRKEFRHITRDVRTFFLVTVAPAFLLVTFSYIFSFDVEHVRLAVRDLDRSYLSRRYIAELTADGDFEVVALAGSCEEIDELIAAGEVDIAIIIPPGFAASVQAGRTAQVQAVVDGADPIVASQSMGALSARTAAFAGQARLVGRSAPSGVLEVRSRAWYNGTLKSLVSMVPGLMAVVLSMPALALALALTREKETGSFEGLVATPLRGPEYLLGKLSAYVACGLVSVVLAFLVATLWFRVPFRGHFLAYMLLAADYLVASMGFSLVIASFVRNQQTAMQVVLLVFFVPSFFIAGLIQPLSTESLGALLTSYSLPTTHFIAISRGVFLKGLGPVQLWQPAIVLAGMGVSAALISTGLFRKRIS